LRIDRYATEYADHLYRLRQRLCKSFQGVCHLRCQLARGHKNQHVHLSGLVKGHLLELLQQRQRKSRRLARAGLRCGQHIATLQDCGDYRCLNRCGREVSLGAHRAQQIGGQTQGGKWHEQRFVWVVRARPGPL
jgi:hypothetical protein